MGTQWEDTPVVFSDVNLHQATVLSTSSPTTLTVRILLVKGEFEVSVAMMLPFCREDSVDVWSVRVLYIVET